jgi:hypothetical protein
MENQTQQEVINVINEHGDGSQTFTSTFGSWKQSVSQQHHTDVENSEKSWRGLLVQNYKADIQGDRVVKVTELQLNGRLFRITDTFTILPVIQSTTELHGKEPTVKIEEGPKMA